MALLIIIALHIVDTLLTGLGNGGIVTTCVLFSTLTSVGVRDRVGDVGMAVKEDEPPVNVDNDDTLTRAGKSPMRSNCTVNSGTGICVRGRLTVGLYGKRAASLLFSD